MAPLSGDEFDNTLLPVAAGPWDELRTGDQAGGYTIVELIGQGGCGMVYLATHDTDGRRAALKVLHRFLASEPLAVERFHREVQSVNLIKHPGIVEIYELGHLPDDRPFYAMELIDGTSLRRLLQLEGRLSPVETFEILERVCAALSAAHAVGIVHRDVKAENVIVRADRSVKLLDFGIAKLVEADPRQPGLTTTQQMVGTLVAMAPEQLRCRPVDQRTDIYGLGIMAYDMLTGVVPFRGDPAEIARMHLESPPRPPGSLTLLPPALDAVVLRCLEKEPAARFPTVEALIEAFRGAVFGGEAPTRARQAVGILVRTCVAGDDEDVLADAVLALDTAEAVLRGDGWTMCVQTSAELLAVRVVPTMAVEELAARRRAIELAGSLLETLATSFAAVNTTVAVHAGEVFVREDTGDITGGPLVEIAAWVLAHDGLVVSPNAGKGLTAV